MRRSQQQKKACPLEGKRKHQGVLDLPQSTTSDFSEVSNDTSWTTDTSVDASACGTVSLGSPLSSLGEYALGDGLEWDRSEKFFHNKANASMGGQDHNDSGNMDLFACPSTGSDCWSTNWDFGTVPQAPPLTYLPLHAVALNSFDPEDYRDYASPENVLTPSVPGATKLTSARNTQETHKKAERRSTRQKATPEKEKTRHPHKHSLSTSVSQQPHGSKSSHRPLAVSNWSSSSNSDSLTRNNHNLVEKQYRNRLNSQFDTLLSVLPEAVVDSRFSGSGEKKVSKAEVLILAKNHISQLEKADSLLKEERDALLEKVNLLKGNWEVGN